jgi:RHS repeat-associated protein
VFDYNGKVYEQLEYMPCGKIWMDETSGDTDFNKPYRFSAKEKNEALTIVGVLCVGLYYYGARYLDPKYSRWISADPALGEYLPQAPVNDEVRKHNQSLPGREVYSM